MKSIKEQFEQTQPIASYLYDRLDEGFFSKAKGEIQTAFANLRDKLLFIKNKFKDAWIYMRGVVAKFGTYILPVDDEGEPMPAISPLTADMAYVEGLIDKATTTIISSINSQKITGNKASWDDARKMYGPGDSRDYWSRMYNESADGEKANITEVRLQTSDPQAKYNVIVDNKRLRDTIIRHIENPKMAKLLIMGAPGIGKTAILDSAEEALKKINPQKYGDFKVITKVLSNETPDNFFLPDYAVVDDQKKATDVPKSWLPVYKPSGDPKKDAEYDKACGRGLLFVDELSRATPQVLNVILPLINEGRLNEYKMGSGWTVIAASNRAEDEMSGQSNIGNALANRFAIVYYEPTVNTWMEWARTQNYMSPLLLQWLSLPESEQMSGGKFYYWDPNEGDSVDAETKIMCTPRSWTNAMRELAVFANTADMEGFKLLDIPFEDIGFIFNQYIPSAAIDTFFSFLSVIKAIGNLDNVAENIWKSGKAPEIKKNDLNKVALPLAQLILTYHSKELPTEKEFANLAKWLVSTNSDQITTYVLNIFKDIYCGDMAPDSMDTLFIVAEAIKTGKLVKNTAKYKLYQNDIFKPFLKKWGLKDISDIPNYRPGMEILIGKYANIMQTYKIDGKLGLD